MKKVCQRNRRHLWLKTIAALMAAEAHDLLHVKIPSLHLHHIWYLSTQPQTKEKEDLIFEIAGKAIAAAEGIWGNNNQQTKDLRQSVDDVILAIPKDTLVKGIPADKVMRKRFAKMALDAAIEKAMVQ